MADDPKVNLNVLEFRHQGSREAVGGGALKSNALQPEDAFQELYFDGEGGKVIKPRIEPVRLKRMILENNTLAQCVEAMAVNCDGTGYDLVPIGTEEPDQEQQGQIDQGTEFLREPWPGQSFITQRKQLRRDQEETGNAYLEVIRNAPGDIVFTRRLDPITVRMCLLSLPIQRTRRIERNGRELDVRVLERERSFVQIVGNQKVYFREFGTSRDIHKDSGDWHAPGNRLPAEERGTEIIHFTALLDDSTPYGIPRWYNQIPSVLGSREAEELNLGYFETGGIPPVLIFLQGGHASPGDKRALENILTGKAVDKIKAAVVEVQPAQGDLSSGNRVSVEVKTFGSEQQKDSLFENYDKRSTDRVRVSFRLPPLFLGQTHEFNFATAFASQLVAEAQVFEPERREFDEKITVTLIRGLGLDRVRLESNKLSVTDASTQLLALNLAVGISDEERVRVLNLISGLDIKLDPFAIDGRLEDGGGESDDDGELVVDDSQPSLPALDSPRGGQRDDEVQGGRKGPQTGNSTSTSAPRSPHFRRTKRGATVVRRSEDADEGLDSLADNYTSVVLGEGSVSPERKENIIALAKNLTGMNRKLFARMLASRMLPTEDGVKEELADLSSTASEILLEEGIV